MTTAYTELYLNLSDVGLAYAVNLAHITGTRFGRDVYNLLLSHRKPALHTSHIVTVKRIANRYKVINVQSTSGQQIRASK